MIEGISKIFVISLPHREDRRILIEEQLKNYGIEYEIWWAVGHHEKGIVGLLMSIKNLFEYCLAHEHYNILVLEDDCHFLIDPLPFFKNVLPQLPTDYHCLYLGLNLTSPPVRVSDNLLRINTAYSTHSILYSKEAMEIVLTLINNETPYDITLMQQLQPKGKCYATLPMIATQRTSYSDIDRVERNWGQVMNMTFTTYTKNILSMEENEVPCKREHLWNGRRMVELLDPMRLEVQHPELWGTACDCGKILIIAESTSGCACDNSVRWEFQIGQTV